MKPQITSLQMFFSPQEGGTGVGFVTSYFFICKKENNETVTVYIPGFNICFPAKDTVDAERLSKNAISAFVKYHIRDDNEAFSPDTVKTFFRKLEGLGFAPSDRNWDTFIDGNALNGQLIINPDVTVPVEFAKLERIYEQLTIAA